MFDRKIFADFETATAGDGSVLNPLEWNQWTTVLSGGTNVSTTFLLKGVKNLGSTPLVLEINTTAADVEIEFINWETTPWALSGTSTYEFNFGNDIRSSSFQSPSKFHLNGGILRTTNDSMIQFDVLDSKQDVEFLTDNMSYTCDG
jgi:hypothetical protein